MPIDPQCEPLLAAAAAAGGATLSDETVVGLRQGFALLVSVGMGEPPAVAEVTDQAAPGPHGPVPVRIYRPRTDAVLPLVVHLHGGGWTIGSVEAFDPMARAIAVAADAVVVSVDYRLAPEHPFPVPYDDAWAGLTWAMANAARLGADPERVALCGDSAGGNLSAVLALRARDEGGPALCFQALVYPVTDCDVDTVSYRENATGYYLERATMEYFWDAYTRGGADPADPRLSPLRASDLRGLPPALVITAEYDPLRDEGEAYARALQAAGVDVELARYDGMIHAFAMLPALLDQGRVAIDHIGAALRRAFGTV